MFFRSEISESLTLKFAEAARKRKEKDLSIISLGLGEPDFETPPAIIEATILELKGGNSRYSSPLGVMSLREQIANKMVTENGIPARPQNILVAAGAKQAFQIILMAMVEPGDEIVVIEPSFVSFVPQIYLAEPDSTVHTVDVDPNTFHLSLDKIESKLNDRTRAIVVNSPNNPAGYVLSESELRALYALAEKYECFVIADEIYEKLVYDQRPHFSPGSIEDTVSRVVTINGFSKSHAMTGWRLGYACYPDSLNQKILKIQQHMNTNTCTFIQSAMANVLPQLDMSYLDTYCKTLKQRRDQVAIAVGVCDTLSLVSPESGFFAFINIEKSGMDSNAFCSALMEKTGVAMTPGVAFGKSWDNHVRLSFATKDEYLEEGLLKLQQFAQGV